MDVRKLNKKVWPYQTEIKSDNSKEIDQWCRDHVGIRFRDWYGYMHKDKRLYAFSDEEMLLVFKLRWGYGDNYVQKVI
jgi:hypothetical protein